MTGNFSDKPISDPSADRYGFDGFAQIVAKSIVSISTADGVVLALNGPWGCGKSSIVSLARHHLATLPQGEALDVSEFKCWWFRGEEALARAFFDHLYQRVGPSLGTKFKKAVRKFGSGITKVGTAAASAADLAGGAGAATAAVNSIAEYIPGTQSVEQLHDEISTMLREKGQRFLIVIDDIDRLAPDEAIQMFRLVKSIGKLPNVTYLLVYDRALATATLARAFPTEGPGYLEKIVQGSFDVPELSSAELSQQLLADVSATTGQRDKIDTVEFMNIFYDVVAPLVRYPRHLTSLSNALALTWPSMGRDVFLADYLAIEAIRLFEFELYTALRRNKGLLCASSRLSGSYDMSKVKARYDSILLNTIPDNEREDWIDRLCRLFPRLREVWRNTFMAGERDGQWSVDRRVCSKDHFDTYFSLSLGAAAMGQAEIEEILSGLSQPGDLEQRLKAGLGTFRRNGMTKASLILDVLTQHSSKVSLSDVETALSIVFRMADDLDVEADKAQAFSIGDNQLRIHWLLRRLLLGRTELEVRSAILMRAAKGGALSWLVDLFWSTHRHYNPKEGDDPERDENCLLTPEQVEELKQIVLERLGRASETGELIASPRLAQLLYSWNDLNQDDGNVVQAWTSAQLKNNGEVPRFARAFTSYGWGQGMGLNGDGDLVAKRFSRVHPDSMKEIVDLALLKSRVIEVLANPKTNSDDLAILSEFLAAWDKADKGERD
jgi:predicted KAP-like P-loop ATPase